MKTTTTRLIAQPTDGGCSLTFATGIEEIEDTYAGNPPENTTIMFLGRSQDEEVWALCADINHALASGMAHPVTMQDNMIKHKNIEITIDEAQIKKAKRITRVCNDALRASVRAANEYYGEEVLTFPAK